jgi:hypothetical protein
LNVLIDKDDDEDKLFILFLLSFIAKFIAVISIGSERFSPPPVHKSTISPIPRYNDIAATPSMAFTAVLPPLPLQLQDHAKLIYLHQQ